MNRYEWIWMTCFMMCMDCTWLYSKYEKHWIEAWNRVQPRAAGIFRRQNRGESSPANGHGEWPKKNVFFLSLARKNGSYGGFPTSHGGYPLVIIHFRLGFPVLKTKPSELGGFCQESDPKGLNLNGMPRDAPKVEISGYQSLTSPNRWKERIPGIPSTYTQFGGSPKKKDEYD